MPLIPRMVPPHIPKYDGKGPLVVRVYSFHSAKAYPKMHQAMEAAMCSTAAKHS